MVQGGSGGSSTSVNVYDGLDSSSKTDALSANQGRIINERLTDVENDLSNKVEKISGKGLSTEDFTTAEKNKLNEIEEGAQKNAVDSVNGKAGEVVLTSSDVGALPRCERGHHRRSAHARQVQVS